MQISEQALNEVVQIYKVLANRNRIKILYFLEKNEADVSTIVEHLDLEQPLVSKQLGILNQYQLISKRKEGKHVYYRLDDPHILKMVDAMLGHVSHEMKGLPHDKKAF